MVFITGEIGINHNGDLSIAKQLIDVAKKAGCNAVKFQKRTIDKVYSKEILDSPRTSPWGETTRDQKFGLEFEKKEYDIIDSYCKEKEIEWFLNGIKNIFPDYWNRFNSFLPIEEREDLLNSYYKRLTSKDPKIYQKAAVSWARYEANCSTLLPNASVYEEFVDTQMAINLARLEAHYFVNKLFLKEGQLLNNINNIFHIKGYIIQGRYDAICPIKSAYDLAYAWPNANLRIIEAAGHSSIEKPIQNALMETTEEIKKTIG